MGQVNTQCLEQGWVGEGMQAIKAVFVKSLVVIGIIPINFLAAAEVAEHPTRGAIQVSVPS